MLRKAYSINRILLAAFLLAALLPVTVLSWRSFTTARESLETEIRRDLQARATATAAEIDRMMFERLQNVSSWSKLEIMQEMRVGDVDKRLSRFLAESKASYGGVYVELDAVDAHDRIIASSEPGRNGQRMLLGGDEQGIALTQGDTRVGRLIVDRLPLSAKIPGVVEGQNGGTLYAMLDWNQVRQILDEASVNGSTAALLDRDGQLLAATPGWVPIDETRRITAVAVSRGFENFPGFGWQVALEQSRAVALKPVRKMARTFAVLLLVSIALAALVAIPISASIVRPLARLTWFARTFISEQRMAPPPAGGPAEVRELSTAFGQMIHDLERLKENLTRAAKLAVVGEMAAAMTHEVRTPLGILRSSAQLLLREPGLSAEGREVCGFIISETERMNRLVTTLLDCARARPPELKPANVAELAAQSIAMLKPQAMKKNIALELHLDDNDATVLCDPEQITQVLLNLLLNALQILPENSRVEISTRRETDHLVIEIADDGPGIAPELRERVFDPFFTQRNGGIGLGLTVVRQIAVAHRGNIIADKSALGGALFRVTLPLDNSP
ncbi:MAG: two-component sensor histidine kinase [Methylobacillus sp.]|jgi:signal transduction histidine kinase|nr:two-component sensor histidine kinase [Methylobacillus sp.]